MPVEMATPVRDGVKPTHLLLAKRMMQRSRLEREHHAMPRVAHDG